MPPGQKTTWTSSVSGSPRLSSGRAVGHVAEVVLGLLESREMSIRELASAISVTPGHLSRVLRAVDGKRASPELLRRIGDVLGVPATDFFELRRALVLERVALDEAVVERLYREFNS